MQLNESQTKTLCAVTEICSGRKQPTNIDEILEYNESFERKRVMWDLARLVAQNYITEEDGFFTPAMGSRFSLESLGEITEEGIELHTEPLLPKLLNLGQSIYKYMDKYIIIRKSHNVEDGKTVVAIIADVDVVVGKFYSHSLTVEIDGVFYNPKYFRLEGEVVGEIKIFDEGKSYIPKDYIPLSSEPFPIWRDLYKRYENIPIALIAFLPPMSSLKQATY